jgi:hypothetical protein
VRASFLPEIYLSSFLTERINKIYLPPPDASFLWLEAQRRSLREQAHNVV